MQQPHAILPLQASDSEVLAHLVKNSVYIHRHLDWRMPEDWLGHQPFLVLRDSYGPQAALACPEDPEGVAWIRFFACSYSIKLLQTWTDLLNEVIKTTKANHPILAAVAIQSWFEHVLIKSGFISRQKIVILDWFEGVRKTPITNSSITIRPILPEDIPVVTEVDQNSFEKLWQLSQAGLTAAYNQSSYATVAEYENEIVGYQISNLTTNSAHLSRLAVLPKLQKKHIGKMLVDDLLSYYTRSGIKHVTVNTQHNNAASLALYKNLGFSLTRESFPVYFYPFDEV